MPKASKKLIKAIRKAALNIETGGSYQWGHLGACNCGHLIQALTTRAKSEIHEAALAKDGDWRDLSHKYCLQSGYKIDDIISELLKAGLSLEDIEYLERLSDPKVLTFIGNQELELKHNRREDVITYMKAWADLLESEMLEPKSKAALHSNVA